MPFSLPAFAIGTALARRQDVNSNAPGLLMGITGLNPVGAVLAETSIRAARRGKKAAVPEPDLGWDPAVGPNAGGDQPLGEDPEVAKLAMFGAVTDAATAVAQTSGAQRPVQESQARMFDAVADGAAAVAAAVRANSDRLAAALDRIGQNQPPGSLGALTAAGPASSEPVEQKPAKGK